MKFNTSKYSIGLMTLMCIGLTLQAQNQIDKQGRKQGHWLRTDKNGAKIFEGDFKDGLETGTFTHFYPNGKPRIKNTYTLPGRYCKHEAYDEQGHLLATGYYNQKNRDSVWHFYNETGRLVKTASYKMGIKQGAHIIFTSTGDTAELTHWVDNHRSGRWWKRIGEKGYITAHYVAGKLSGTMVEYDDNGKLVRKGSYSNGTKHGAYQYYENGMLTVDETWDDGSLVGRKILVTTTTKEYIPTTYIAYVYPRQQRSVVVLMDGSIKQATEQAEILVSRMGMEQFLMVDQRNRIVANSSCIRGLTRDDEGREILDLDPIPTFQVFPDADCKKLVQSLMRGDELDQ